MKRLHRRNKMKIWIFVYMCIIFTTLSSGENFTISLLYPGTDPEFFTHYFGAFVMAITNTNTDSLVNNHNITFLYTIEDTKGGTADQKEERSIRYVTEGGTQHINAFVGPGLESCSYTARVAATFDKPMIGYVCIIDGFIQ